MAASLLKIITVDASLTNAELDAICNQYIDDLPYPETLASEMKRWKIFSEDKGSANTVTSALDICDRDIFPNIHVLLRIAATLPVTTCTCERSFSTLRRLNTYLRATQSTDRLDALALINIHCGMSIDIDLVINTFAKLHPRRMELGTVL